MSINGLSIRLYTPHDYPEIISWWNAVDSIGPFESMLPLDTTFVCTLDSEMVAMISLYLTNCKDVTYAENICGNPLFKGPIRRAATQMLADYCYDYARNSGYKHIVTYSAQPKNDGRFEQMGLSKVITGLTAFGKIL